MLSSVPSAYSNYRLVTKLLSGNYGILCVVEWRLYTSLPLVGPPLPLTTVYPLDSLSSTALSSANGLFSTKRLLSKYQGPVVNLRRSTDSATLDFFADALGNLFNGRQTVQGWLAGATAYVTTWYDQSGQGNHATQTTTSAQPTYLSNTKQMNFTSGQYWTMNAYTFPLSGSYTVSARHGAFTNNTGMFGGGQVQIGKGHWVGIYVTPYYNDVWDGSDFNATGTVAANNTISFVFNCTTTTPGAQNGSTTFYLNSVSTSTLASRLTAWNGTAGTYAYIGTSPNIGTEYYVGQIMYVSAFTSALSNADRLILEAQP